MLVATNLIGASANLVAAGACEANGRRISFFTFLRYAFPIMVCPLAVFALYAYILGTFVLQP